MLLLGADAAFGVVASGRSGCAGPGGTQVDVDLALLPVTSGLLLGSVGSAQAHVPWDGPDPGALREATLSGRTGTHPGYEVTSVSVDDTGITLGLRLALPALTGGAEACRPSISPTS